MPLNDDSGQQINIIKKKKTVHASHGGAWKVAYADFVTAMMSLFIVLWILGQSKQVKEYVAEYFRDPGAFNEKTHSSVMQGGLVPLQNQSPNRVGVPLDQDHPELLTLTAEGKKLADMINSNPEFKNFNNQIKITVTKEGLRIELIENAEGLFFDLGSAELKPYTGDLLRMIAKELATLPNQIVIEGYTDARQYVKTDYTNWELSTDRANAARRVMMDGGLKEDQVLQVRGYADRKLSDPEHPYDYSNRRVSILVTPFTHPSQDTVSQEDTLKIGG